MKENERSISERGRSPREFYSEREIFSIHARDESESCEAKEENTTVFKPCVVYISGVLWTTVTIGAVVGLLIHSARDAEREYKEENFGFLPRVERMMGDSPDKLLSQMIKEYPTVLPVTVEPTTVPSPAVPVTDISQPVGGGAVVSGKATYYGIDDGYGLQNRLGCTHEPFDPHDPETAARPENSPFVCGDIVEVCDADSCIDVEIKDTCPGCDAKGIVIDLSYGAMENLTGKHGTTVVTIRKK